MFRDGMNPPSGASSCAVARWSWSSGESTGSGTTRRPLRRLARLLCRAHSELRRSRQRADGADGAGIELAHGYAAVSDTERYLLQLIGNDVSDDPALPPCSPILVPRGGKFITTFLWFQWEGEELVGQSRPPYAATAVIRLRRVSSSIGGVIVDGTVTGTVPDEVNRIMGQRDTTFSADGAVTLSGLVTPRIRDDVLGPTLSGWMRGNRSRSGTRRERSRSAATRSGLPGAGASGRAARDPTVPPLRHRALRAGAVGAGIPGDGASAPTAPPSESADRRFCPDFIDVLPVGSCGTAVALGETVTDRWAAGNQNH